MARPIKTGLDYFPLDVDLDYKIQAIEADHGAEGFMVVIKLFQAIYKNSYYLEFHERHLKVFSRQNYLQPNKLKSIISDCIKERIFDDELFEKYQILTSKGIQKRYFTAIKGRRAVEVKSDFLLVNATELVHKKLQIYDICSSLSETNDSLSEIKYTKKRKEKKRKVNKNTLPSGSDNTREGARGETTLPKNFELTESMKKFCEKCNPDRNADEIFDAFCDYYSFHGFGRGDPESGWRHWCRREKKINGNNYLTKFEKNKIKIKKAIEEMRQDGR